MNTYDVYCYEWGDVWYRSRMVVKAKTATQAEAIARKKWYDPRGKVEAERRW